jgi:hypothetical protein
MGADKEPGGNVRKFERPRSEKPLDVGDRVVIKKELWEKYVRDVEVPEADIDVWREARAAVKEGLSEEQAKEADDLFLDSFPHPRGDVVAAPQLFIVDKMPGKYKLAPLPNSKRFVWVDSADVDEYPLTK